MARSSRYVDVQRTPNPRPRRAHKTRKPLIPLVGRRQQRSSHVPPPVMVRNIVPITQPSEPLAHKHRRRYDVALSIPGAELRLPSLPAMHVSWRILSMMMAVAIAASLYLVWSQPQFRINAVEIRGMQRITSAEINTVIDVIDKPVFMINPGTVYKDIEQAFPEMAAITVEVGLPAAMIITVDERVPVVVWQEENRELWIDADGVAFPARGEPVGMIRVVGVSMSPITGTVSVDGEAVYPVSKMSEPYLDSKLVSAIQTLAPQLPKNATLVYDREKGLGWKEKRGLRVYFGKDVENIEMKLRMYDAITDRLNKAGIKALMISVENIHAPYIRVER